MLSRFGRAHVLAPLLAFGVAVGCERKSSRSVNPERLGATHLYRAPEVPLVHDGMARIAASATASEDGQWVRPLKDYAGSRYSGLDQIDRTNVATLRLAWRHTLHLERGQEATPVVANGMMYVVGSFPNPLIAYDLARPGPSVRWTYTPNQATASQGVACCGHVNRGAVYANGRLFYVTLDGQAIALDAATGSELWKVRLGDIQVGESMTMAPLVVGDLVLVGNSGGEFGVRGWIAALDAATGAERWRAYSTGPDADVLIGPEFAPFYEDHRGADLGRATWPEEKWKIGGGTVWGWITYDPELDLIYHGTANAAPWNQEARAGENKWAATVFARRPRTGAAVWAYQWDPHNAYVWDGVNESVLLDLPVDGSSRRVLARAERNGYLYLIDRATGEVLSADAYVHATAHKGVDLRTGRPERDLTKLTGFDHTARDICPSVAGGKNREPMAFSPRTGLLYIPVNNICQDMQGIETNYIAGTPYLGVRNKMYAGPGGHLGELLAWDPVRREKVWGVREQFLTWSGALATAGDLVFYGTLDGKLKALDARTGVVLWQYETSTGIIAPPITYLGPDGRQYVAVLSGPGGWAGSVVGRDIDSRDSTADRGMANAMAKLPQYTGRGGYLYVFELP